MILFAGALLLTPGFFTDGIGFLLLTAWFRNIVFKVLKKNIVYKTFKQREMKNFKNQTYSRYTQNDKIIEGEYWEDDPKKPE